MILFFINSISVINANTTNYIQPRKDIISQRCIEHITLLASFAFHALLSPEWVLHSKCIRILFFPILSVDVACRIETFEHTNIIKVFTTWEQPKSWNWVEVFTRTHHVLIVLNNVRSTKIQRKLVIKELACVTDREVITVVIRFRHYTWSICNSCRSKCLVLFVTYSECQ